MTLPTLDELRELEHYSLVAYATRCAMRIRCLAFEGVAHEGNSERVQELVDRSIAVAYKWINNREKPNIQAALKLQLALYDLSYCSSFPPVATAFDALRAAGFDATTDRQRTPARDLIDAHNELAGIVYSCSLKGHNAFFESEMTVKYDLGCRHDYNILFRLDSLIDPRESGPLGPLWPDGILKGYLLKKNGGFTIDLETGMPIVSATKIETDSKIEFGVSAEVTITPATPLLNIYFDTEEFSDEEMAEILSGISDLYYEISGDVLVIKRTETLDPAVVFEPEGV